MLSNYIGDKAKFFKNIIMIFINIYFYFIYKMFLYHYLYYKNMKQKLYHRLLNYNNILLL